MLLSSCQELPQPGNGHLGIHQLTNQLRQLEQRHPQYLQAVRKFGLKSIPVQVVHQDGHLLHTKPAKKWVFKATGLVTQKPQSFDGQHGRLKRQRTVEVTSAETRKTCCNAIRQTLTIQAVIRHIVIRHNVIRQTGLRQNCDQTN